MVAKTKTPKSKGTASKRRRRGVTIEPVSLQANELPVRELEAELRALQEQVERDGGAVIGAYREPLGGHSLLLVALPIEQGRADAVPARRDRRARAQADARDGQDQALPRSDRSWCAQRRALLDAERQPPPDGAARSSARARSSRCSCPSPRSPTRSSRSTSRRRTTCASARSRSCACTATSRGSATRKESDFELEFEEPALVTLGFAYEQRGRLAGGAYHPRCARSTAGSTRPLAEARRSERERRAALLLELDDAVNEAVAKLKERGLTSPYLQAASSSRASTRCASSRASRPGFDELFATHDQARARHEGREDQGRRPRAQRRRAPTRTDGQGRRGASEQAEHEAAPAPSLRCSSPSAPSRAAASSCARTSARARFGILCEQGNFERARMLLSKRVGGAARGRRARTWTRSAWSARAAPGGEAWQAWLVARARGRRGREAGARALSCRKPSCARTWCARTSAGRLLERSNGTRRPLRELLRLRLGAAGRGRPGRCPGRRWRSRRCSGRRSATGSSARLALG